jgi:dipeptidyl aminopeptidase/acylaminoacyl peptidase
MNRRLSILFALTSVLLGAVLVSACKPESRSQLVQQASTATIQPTVTVTSETATAMTALTSTLRQPAACQFTNTALVTSSSPTESYTFSEPQVVFTSTKQGVLEIYGWLPDNSHLLINGYDKNIDKFTVEVLNVQTGELQRYAERQADYWTGWLPQQQALAYIDSEYINAATGTIRRDLWISRGDPKQAERVVSGVDDEALAIDSADRLTSFTQDQSNQPSGSQLLRLDVAAQTSQALPLDLTQWELPRYSQSNEAVNRQSRRLQSAWRPGTDSQILFYFSDLGALLADTRTGQLCEIELRQQNVPLVPVRIAWSPDGQYLAALVKAAGAERYFRRLLVVDMNTGQQFVPELDTDAPVGAEVLDIEWDSDSRHLAALTAVIQSYTPNDVIHRLYLVDVPVQAVQQMLPNTTESIGDGGGPGEMSWSPDGRHLAINCPIWPRKGIIEKQRICLITVSEVP